MFAQAGKEFVLTLVQKTLSSKSEVEVIKKLLSRGHGLDISCYEETFLRKSIATFSKTNPKVFFQRLS